MFINDHRRHGAHRGFTLPELSVSIAVSAIILTALLTFTSYAARSFAGMENYVDLEQKSQNALDVMTSEIRQTQCLTNFTTRTLASGQAVTNSLTFWDSDNSNLTYTFTNDVLVRSKGGVDTVLLENVDYLTFQLYQRNPKYAEWAQFDAGDIATCKLISVSWVCSRSILGSRINTESVQTAKIIIRKE
jgi:prepilin-type N-terminal cleavage/methylation domain-containing protein